MTHRRLVYGRDGPNPREDSMRRKLAVVVTAIGVLGLAAP
jgi:hypothetical protein